MASPTAGVVALAALALAAPAWSSENATTPPSTWAGGACTAITNWFSGLSSLTISLQYKPLTRQSLRSATGKAAVATHALAQNLAKLGTPDIPSGRQAPTTMAKLAASLEAERKAVTRVVDAATSSKQLDATYASAKNTFTTTIPDQLISTIKLILKRDHTGRLVKGFKQASSCKTIPDVVNALVG